MSNAKDDLSSEVSYATKTANTTNEPSVIVEWDLSEQPGLRIAIEEGQPLIFDAKNSSGNDLPADTQFAFSKVRPDSELQVGDLFTEFSIRPFNALSRSQQQSGENAQRRRLDYDPQSRAVENGDIVVFNDSDTIKLYADCSDSIDPTTITVSYPAHIDD